MTVDIIDAWLLLAAAVARGERDPEERRRWQEWAIARFCSPAPTRALQGRRRDFEDIFNERRNVNRWKRKHEAIDAKTD